LRALTSILQHQQPCGLSLIVMAVSVIQIKRGNR